MSLRAAWVALCLWWLAACADPGATGSAERVPGGLELTSAQPIEEVHATTVGGAAVGTWRPPEPVSELHVPMPVRLSAGLHLEVSTSKGSWKATIPARPADDGPVEVRIEAPLGQPAADPELRRVPVVVPESGEVHVGVVVTARGAVRVTVELDGAPTSRHLAPGERLLAKGVLGASGPLEIVVRADGWRREWTLVPTAVEPSRLGEWLTIEAVRFPADARGAALVGRPSDRVTLAAAWWRSLLRSFSLGYRARDHQAPWAWRAVDLVNDGADPIDVVVTEQVFDLLGEPHPAFVAQVREGAPTTPYVAARLRVPARSRATAVLPLYVDGAGLPGPTGLEARVAVLPVGWTEPIATAAAPLWVSRGSTWASLGFVVLLLASAIGWTTMATQGPRWLRSARTPELLVVGLFGSLTFVVATAAQLLGMGVAAVLGPFAPFLTGLVDDAFRTVLLATLVALYPRPGIVSLAAIVGWLLRGLALGSFHPLDLLYLGCVVTWLEGWLWFSGLTRSARWLDEGRLRRWFRLTVGFGGAQVCASATGLVASVVLYRLYYAGWYVVALLALPGFVYIALACVLAVPFAESMRRVRP